VGMTPGSKRVLMFIRNAIEIACASFERGALMRVSKVME
jgi:hypothetical protein